MPVKRYLEIGKIVSVHGLSGDVKVQPWSNAPEDLLQFSSFYIDTCGEKVLSVTQSRVQKRMLVMHFSEVKTVEEAQKLRNSILYIDREDYPLPKGQYFIQDLIGLAVYDQNNPSICYGKVREITQYGASDVYHLEDDAGNYRMFPGIPQVLKEVNLRDRFLLISPLEGLFDEN